jgi:hypothetical protein
MTAAMGLGGTASHLLWASGADYTFGVHLHGTDSVQHLHVFIYIAQTS